MTAEFSHGGKIAYVLKQARLGVPNNEIGEALGISPSEVGVKKSVLRAYGLLPRLTPEDHLRALREAHYVSSGSQYPLASQFERMHMAPSEQVEAVWQTHNVRLDGEKLRSSGKRARHVEGRQRGNGDSEHALVVRDTRSFRQDTPERVRFWRMAGTFLEENDIDFPETRGEWMRLAYMARLTEMRIIIPSIGEWSSVIDIYGRRERDIPIRWPTADLADEIRFIKVEKEMLEYFFLEDSQTDLIENDVLDVARFPKEWHSVVKQINKMKVPLEDKHALLTFHIFAVTHSNPMKKVTSVLGMALADVERCIDYVIDHLEDAWNALESRILERKRI